MEIQGTLKKDRESIITFWNGDDYYDFIVSFQVKFTMDGYKITSQFTPLDDTKHDIRVYPTIVTKSKKGASTKIKRAFIKEVKKILN